MPTIDDALLDQTGSAILDQTGDMLLVPNVSRGTSRWWDSQLLDQTGAHILDQTGDAILMPNSERQGALAFDGVDRGAGDSGSMAVDCGTTGAGGVAGVSGVGAAAAFTLECRILTGNITLTSGHIIAGRYRNGGVAGEAQPVLYIINNTLRALVRDNAGAVHELISGAIVGANTKYVVACDYDGTTFRLYLNGAVVDSEAVTGVEATSNDVPFQIGRDVDAGAPGGYPFAGIIDEVRWSKVARYAGTYQPATSPFTSDANTLGLWHLDGSEGNFVQDSSGNQKHGRLIGAYKPTRVESPWFYSYEWWNGTLWVPTETFIAYTGPSPGLIPVWPDRAEAFEISLKPIDSLGAAGDYTSGIFAPLQTLSPGGIATGQAMGAVGVLAISRLFPGGIASAQALGTPTIVATQQNLSPGGIASAQAFGTATIIRGAVTVFPGGIASAQAFGAVTVLPGARTLLPGGIASAQAFGNPILTAGIFVLPGGIASAEVFGAVAVLPGSRTLSPGGIASAQAFGNPALSMIITVLPSGIATAQALGNPSLALGPISVLGQGIASAEAFGLPYVNTQVTLLPSGIASAESVSPLVLAADEAERTVAAGSWGNADVGGAWSQANALFSVSGGKLRYAATGGSLTNRLAISALEVDMKVLVDLDILPVGGNFTALMRARVNGAATSYYESRIAFAPGGGINLVVAARLSPAAATVLATIGLGTYTPGDQWALRFRVTGANPTRVQAKAWKVGTAEPDWMYDALEATLGPQTASGVSLGASQSVTNSPVMSFDSFRVVNADATAGPVILPTISVLPGGIASLQVFGNPTLIPGAVILVPVGIGSAEAFGFVLIIPPGIAWRDVGLIAKNLRLVPGTSVLLLPTTGSMELMPSGSMELIPTAGSIRIIPVAAHLKMEDDIYSIAGQ